MKFRFEKSTNKIVPSDQKEKHGESNPQRECWKKAKQLLCPPLASHVSFEPYKETMWFRTLGMGDTQSPDNIIVTISD